MFYAVYYYHITLYSNPTIYLAGFYKNIDDAINRIDKIVPNYEDHINNTVTNKKTIAWINTYKFGDLNDSNSSNKLYNAVNIFDPNLFLIHT